MNAGLINRLINIVRKTGHRVVFGDPETGQAVVVMDLAEYEHLVDLNAVEDVIETYDSNIQHLQTERPTPKNDDSQPPLKETPEVVPEEKIVAPIEIKVQHEEPQDLNRANDLTPSAPKANINREISGQKTSQGKRRNQSNRSSARPQNKPVNQPVVQPPKPEVQKDEPAATLEDEERFYLEPLE